MAAGKLRVVTEDEKAPPKSITEAASSGTHRELLVAMRDRIAVAVEDPACPPRDLASLSRRLHELSRDIEQYDAIESEEVAAGGGQVADEAFDASSI